MAGQVQTIERLRDFLRDLKPGSRALLIAELERGILRGDSLSGAEVVLTELRRSLRDGNVKTLRFGDPARVFFQPLEPFLVDDSPEHKHRGRIARSTLEPKRLWISNNLMPEEARAYSEQVEQALLAGDTEKVDHLAHAFQDRAVHRIRQQLDALAKDDKERRRLTVQLGTLRALETCRRCTAFLAPATALPRSASSFRAISTC
jgi:hypothetical protein